MKLLSIIVPVYNVEEYIHPCLESIYNQGLDEKDFEVIIVNDGTNDNSMEIIKDIISHHTNIIIINQQNQGISMARNKGLEKATGEYVQFIDSDDLIVKHCLPILLEKAIKSQADLIVADYKRIEDEEIKKYLKDPSIVKGAYKVYEKKGSSLFLEDLNPRECYIWRTLYRKEFLIEKNILFIPGICYEDIPFIHECYLKANKCLRITLLLYLYRIGHTSITTKLNKKTGIDFGTAIAKTWELRNLDGLSPKIKEKLYDNIFATLSILLYSIIHDVKETSDKKIIINHLKEVAPDLCFSQGVKQQFINFMFHKMPYTYIYIRSLYAKLTKI